MKKFIVFIVLGCCSIFIQAMDKKEPTEIKLTDISKPLIINQVDQLNKQQIQSNSLCTTIKPVYQQMRERYNLVSDSDSDSDSSDKDSVKITIGSKQKNPKRLTRGNISLQQFMDIGDLAKKDPNTSLMLDLFGQMLQTTQEKYKKTKKKLKATDLQLGVIKKNQESKVRDYVHEGSNFGQNIVQFIGIVITIVITEIIKNYTKTA